MIWALLCAAFAAALVGIIAGALFSGQRERVRVAVPLSAGLMLGVVVFGLLPELARDLSIGISLLLLTLGFVFLTALDRMGIRICPDCSHDHAHEHCSSPLHGFAAPVLITCCLHSLFDGWSLAASTLVGSDGVRVALPLALVIHKLPEGLAIGGLVNASMSSSRWKVIGLAAAAEFLTLVGGAVALMWGSHLGTAWTIYPLALACGAFLYFGIHALHGAWKTMRMAMLRPGLAGLLLSAVLQTGVYSYLRI